MTFKPLKISKVFYTTCFFIFSIHIFSQTQLGSDIDGEALSDQSGYSVSLSSDGTIVAIGAVGNDNRAGHTRIYQYNGVLNSWAQLGGDIDGEAATDNSGRSVSLSSDGSIVAIGAYLNDGTATNAGRTRIYQYNGVLNSWAQLGGDINGEANQDFSGFSVSLSSDGTKVAIGAYGKDDGSKANAGYTRIYQYDGVSWTQLGPDIYGEAANDQSGYSVSLSSDGTIVAIGAGLNNETEGRGKKAGRTRIYQYSSGSWSQLGYNIDGEAAYDYSGYSVSLSSDGTKVAIGASGNDNDGI